MGWFGFWIFMATLIVVENLGNITAAIIELNL